MSGRPPHPSSSRSFQAPHSILHFSSSRPFLNMMNPLGRTHQGYVRADQSVLEEEENQRSSDDDDLEAGQTVSHIFRDQKSRSKSHRHHRVSWGADASEMNVLHPNIRQEDKIHEHESSDDEVPQSFMIEASSGKHAKAKNVDTAARSGPNASPRQAPHSLPGRRSIPVSSTTRPPPVSIPLRPSEPDVDSEHTPRPSRYNSSNSPHGERQFDPMRGLDAYERALWNWVNVYNLDAFLQEAYYYYEGKGIYSIALARGLNLLLVMSP
jgi:autophagy-related protein 9